MYTAKWPTLPYWISSINFPRHLRKLQPKPQPCFIMASNETDIPPFFRIYKDGKVERYFKIDFVPPSHDPTTDVQSKDVVFSPENAVSARLFLPKSATAHNQKLPLLIYIHGGGFTLDSAFSSQYHSYVNTLVAEAKAIAVSIEYRLAPEHALPACYEDCWEAINWVKLHATGQGPDPWLNDYADFDRIFIAGDSAGANIAHHMAIQTGINGIKILGIILVHPFFADDEASQLLDFICRDLTGIYDPRRNPVEEMDMMAKMECNKVLVCTSEKDGLRGRGWHYYETVKKSNWKGEIELLDFEEEGHVFHLLNPTSENAALLMKKIVNFMN
ncbi:probable carboxylesterase 12 [Olea europaea subsp. europaea]|uniref:Probable carboxylesterase 12 n=1 Tax=Olea europaea subsp. europaea TaxID=158383 RepID=A0A8S0QI97_OLEEU|nr:probable carboxylesterase 12 [Olea europaea subsp. europaea]